jgi:hypothetical protein
MLRRGFGVVWACVVLGAFVGCFGPGGTPVQNPAPIAAAGSLEATEQAIIDTLPNRGWTTETVEPGRIVAFLAVKGYLLRVEIRYDAQQVEVVYVNSDQLKEERKDGKVYAHKKVNGWMLKLQRELQAGMAQAASAPNSGGVAVPPAEDSAAGTVPAGSGQVPAPNQ